MINQPSQLPKSKFGSDFFAHIDMTQSKDLILRTLIAHHNDTYQDKINLGVGAYRDNDGLPYIFKAVLEAEDRIREGKHDKEYTHIFGLAPFRAAAQKLLFGDDCTPVKQGRVTTIQTLSGIGALNLGFHFLRLRLHRNVYIPDPTWASHPTIVQEHAMPNETYPYFDFVNLEIKIPQMLDFLQKAEEGSIILLHACAHNPTGADPSEDEWKQIADVMKRKNHFPFFDIAYQGMASGDVEKDAWAVRYFAEQGFQMFVAHSFSKNMGLYGERVGALHIVAHNTQTLNKIISQMMSLARNSYISPPIHGALIAQTILNDKELRESWLQQLRDVVYKRLEDVRIALKNELQANKVPGLWQKMIKRKGMFFYCGLSHKQCEILANKHHVYMLPTGRVSLTGINTHNIQRIVQAFKEAIEEAPRLPPKNE